MEQCKHKRIVKTPLGNFLAYDDRYSACTSVGETEEEAMMNLKLAIKSWHEFKKKGLIGDDGKYIGMLGSVGI